MLSTAQRSYPVLVRGYQQSCESIITESVLLYGQVTKRTRRRTWQSEAMKDVGARDQAGGVGKEALIPA